MSFEGPKRLITSQTLPYWLDWSCLANTCRNSGNGSYTYLVDVAHFFRVMYKWRIYRYD